VLIGAGLENVVQSSSLVIRVFLLSNDGMTDKPKEIGLACAAG
jgi:hypothetical protein